MDKSLSSRELEDRFQPTQRRSRFNLTSEPYQGSSVLIRMHPKIRRISRVTVPPSLLVVADEIIEQRRLMYPPTRLDGVGSIYQRSSPSLAVCWSARRRGLLRSVLTLDETPMRSLKRFDQVFLNRHQTKGPPEGGLCIRDLISFRRSGTSACSSADTP